MQENIVNNSVESTEMSDISDLDYVPGSGSSGSSSSNISECVSNYNINNSSENNNHDKFKRKPKQYTAQQLNAAIAYKTAMPNISYTELQKLFGPIPKQTISSRLKRHSEEIKVATEEVANIASKRKTAAAKHAVLSRISNSNAISNLNSVFATSNNKRKNSLRAVNELFNIEEESNLEQWLVEMSKVALAVSKQTFLEKVRECVAIKKDIGIEDVKLGKNWFRRFMKRCKLIKMVKSNIYELKRASSLSKQVLIHFADLLETLFAQLNITDPEQIIAFDETGFSGTIDSNNKFHIHAVSNLRTEWGKNIIATGEIPDHISLLHICDAAGNAYPPYYVFSGTPGKIVLAFATDQLNGKYLTSNKGSFLSVHFEQIIQFIHEHNMNKLQYRADLTKPLIILCDGAPVHFNLKMLEKARELNIHIVTLPANTTHITQLQDRFIFNRLKREFKKQARANFLKTNAMFTEFSFIQIINSIWTEVNKADKIQRGFNKLGYWPFDKSKILAKANSDATKPAEIFEENKMELDINAANVLQSIVNSDNHSNENNHNSPASYNYNATLSIIDINNLKSVALSAHAALKSVENAYNSLNSSLSSPENQHPNNGNLASEALDLCRTTSNELKQLLEAEIVSPVRSNLNVPRTLQAALVTPTFGCNGKPIKSIRKLNQTNSMVLTSDETFNKITQAHLDKNKIHCQRIKAYLNTAAEIVIGHALKPIHTLLQHKGDVADLLGHVLDDQHEAKLKSYDAGILELPLALEEAINKQQIQVIRNVKKLFPKLTKTKLEALLNQFPPRDRSYVQHGGIVSNKLQQEQIAELLQVDLHNNSAIGQQLTASSLFIFNQSMTICGGHFDGADGYLWLKSGLKLWLSIPFDTPIDTIDSWKLKDLLEINDREWLLQYPGDLVVVSAFTKHIVISLKPCVAFSGFFNSMIGLLDAVDLWLQVRARDRLDETAILKEYGIDYRCMDAILVELIKSIKNLRLEAPNSTRAALKDLYNKRKTSLLSNSKHCNNTSIVSRVKELIKTLNKL